jgi:hypothetical protein
MCYFVHLSRYCPTSTANVVQNALLSHPNCTSLPIFSWCGMSRNENILRPKIINTLSAVQFDFRVPLKNKLLFFPHFALYLLCFVYLNLVESKSILDYHWSIVLGKAALNFHEIVSLLVYLGRFRKKRKQICTGSSAFLYNCVSISYIEKSIRR